MCCPSDIVLFHCLRFWSESNFVYSQTCTVRVLFSDILPYQLLTVRVLLSDILPYQLLTAFCCLTYYLINYWLRFVYLNKNSQSLVVFVCVASVWRHPYSYSVSVVAFCYLTLLICNLICCKYFNHAPFFIVEYNFLVSICKQMWYGTCLTAW